jgi:hypothetical protein
VAEVDGVAAIVIELRELTFMDTTGHESLPDSQRAVSVLDL